MKKIYRGDTDCHLGMILFSPKGRRVLLNTTDRIIKHYE